MSNEYKDWIMDKECDRAIHHVAKKIYNYAYGTFFGRTPEQIDFRVKYGSRGAESQVLSYIWNNFVAPYEDEADTNE